ncbi:hypothetical protein HI914_00918 [Erysiphe necator]|nr:hypothetical protein HI914_00918 [Erysiphe necator]
MKSCLKNIGHKGSTVTAGEVDGAIEAFNKYKLIWLLADRMSLLEKRVYVIRQMRINDTEVFVQSSTQRDAPLKMA